MRQLCLLALVCAVGACGGPPRLSTDMTLDARGEPRFENTTITFSTRTPSPAPSPWEGSQ